jgi:hypothetical protein
MRPLPLLYPARCAAFGRRISLHLFSFSSFLNSCEPVVLYCDEKGNFGMRSGYEYLAAKLAASQEGISFMELVSLGNGNLHGLSEAIPSQETSHSMTTAAIPCL